MNSEEYYLGKKRLGVYTDIYAENSFIVKNAVMVFARINKVGDKWHVWYYKSHLQKDFKKLREALSTINNDFIEWYLGKNEIY